MREQDFLQHYCVRRGFLCMSAGLATQFSAHLACRYGAQGPCSARCAVCDRGGLTRCRCTERGWARFEPWCVEVSRVSGSVEQCRGSVGAVSVDTGVGVSGSVGLQCRGSVGAVSRLLDSGDVRVVSRCQAVSECRSVGVSGCRSGVEVSECRCPTQTATFSRKVASFDF